MIKKNRNQKINLKVLALIMRISQNYQEVNMEVFLHHIYEFEKGIRNLILHTLKQEHLDAAIGKLEKRHISYKIYMLENGNYNIFFGNKQCIDVIQNINKENLSNYTPEEDFILGIMLGYDRKKQCERYISLKNKIKTK